MKVDVLDKKGKPVEKIELNKSVFGVKPRKALLAQYVRVYSHNQRQGTSKVKTRAEVSGGGRKPWRQKGSGRARHGSTRSPIWRTGGITHGPQPKSWNLNISKKMKQAAIRSALTLKASGKAIKVLKDVDMKSPKTSELKDIMKKIKSVERNTLLVLDKNDINVRKSASNISWLSTALVANLNAFELLRAKELILTKDAVKFLEDKYGGK